MESATKKRILVTGGGGFLGGAVVKRLKEAGHRVAAFSRNEYPALSSMGIRQISGDIADRHAVFNAVEGMDAVFHVAARPGVWGSYESYHTPNVTGTVNIVDGCLEHGVPHLVYTGSPSVVFDGKDMEGVTESVPYPRTYHAHYPKTKALAEQYVVRAASRGLSTVTLRPHLIWGPGDNHLVPRIIQKGRRLVKFGDAAKKVDTIYIDNAADAHLLALTALERDPSLSGNVYFISQDDPVPVWEMIDAILAAGGLPPVKKKLPYGIVRTVGAMLEKFYTLFGIQAEPPMTRFIADELATSHWFDISAAKRDLGYVPAVSTEEGLGRLGDWLSSRPLIGS